MVNGKLFEFKYDAFTILISAMCDDKHHGVVYALERGRRLAVASSSIYLAPHRIWLMENYLSLNKMHLQF